MIEYLPTIKFGISTLKDAYKFSTKYVKSPASEDNNSLARHIAMCESWSGSVSIFGMSKPNDLEAKSIELSISDKPRKFGGRNNGNSQIYEADIIKNKTSYIILGDPGSGKTTLLKRIIRKLILSSEYDEEDSYVFPLLILGRELTSRRNLIDTIFDIIGFSVIAPQAGLKPGDLKKYNDELVIDKELAVQKSIFSAKIVILLDGIDEIEPSIRAHTLRQMETLNNIMHLGSLIATCRSGDWTDQVSNFDIIEILPLNETEIFDIVSLWASEPEQFLKKIDAIPYKDVLNRPLFLAMLILIFNQTGDMPDQPIDVYFRVVNLLIFRWDSERHIKRESRYKGFLSERKFRFLCMLSYQIAVSLKKTRFSSSELERCIDEIGGEFDLKSWDSASIAQEIESHTGIIIESGFNNFEFCHLTIQEFLAAHFLVSLPTINKATSLLAYSPSTVAVATAISSDPTEFFLEVMSRSLGSTSEVRKPISQGQNPMRTFVSRLNNEKPRFRECIELGVAACLCLNLENEANNFQIYDEFIAPYIAFINMPPVRLSIMTLEHNLILRQSIVPFNGVELEVKDMNYNYEITNFKLSGRTVSTLGHCGLMMSFYNEWRRLGYVA